MANERLKLIYKNYCIESGVTFSVESGTVFSALPVTNLGIESRQYIMRAAGSNVVVKMDLGSPRVVNVLATVGDTTNTGFQPTTGGVIVYSGNSGTPFASATNHGTLGGRGDGGVRLLFLDSPFTAQCWWFSFSDSLNPLGYIDVANVVVGPVFDLERGAAGASIELVDPSPVSYAPAGAPYAYELDTYQTMRIPLGYMTHGQAWASGDPLGTDPMSLVEILRRIGIKRDMILTLYAGTNEVTSPQVGPQTTLYGRFTRLPTLDFHKAKAGDLWSGTIEFRESL